jgi:hypothetical protein
VRLKISKQDGFQTRKQTKKFIKIQRSNGLSDDEW